MRADGFRPRLPALLATPGDSGSFNRAAMAQMERLVADLRHLYDERNEALRAVSRAHRDALLRLSRAAELHDDDTGVHILRMGFLAERLALRMGLPHEFAAMLRWAAPMHDIGKIGVPDAVLKKPGSLTAEERAVMNRHPEIGAELLGRSRIPLFMLAADVALGHHERWDGGGYPQGLSGEDIPLPARIVAVVDYYDAITMDRCYRKAFSSEQALDMLGEQRGRAFDPRVVDVFLAHQSELEQLRDRINRDAPDLDSLVESD